MMESRTTWEDTGYDCDHCGGQIFQRTDLVPNRQPKSYHECRQCGCQWSMSRRLVRIGNRPQCERQQLVTSTNRWPALPRWLWIVAAVLLVLLVIRTGPAGLLLLRFFVPMVIVALIVFLAFRIGKQQRWW